MTTRPNKTKVHFDDIAASYDAEIPEHIRLHLLKKKTNAMLAHLPAVGPEEVTGLDCGCGTGHYLARMAAQGFRMSGFEYSAGMLAQAKLNNPDLQDRLILGSITEMPYADQSFEFCYAINVLHHLPTRSAQVDAVNEMLRVTRDGGLVFLHDFDADNPLARFYMDYIFALTSKIDDDETEIWVSPKDFRDRGFDHSVVKQIDRFTLMPNVTPRIGFGLSKCVEATAERLFRRRFGAHFMMVLEKKACS